MSEWTIKVYKGTEVLRVVDGVVDPAPILDRDGLHRGDLIALVSDPLIQAVIEEDSEGQTLARVGMRGVVPLKFAQDDRLCWVFDGAFAL